LQAIGPIDLVQFQSSCTQGVCNVCDVVLWFYSFGCSAKNACFLINLAKDAVMGWKERPIAPFREEGQRQQLCLLKGTQGELLVAGQISCDTRQQLYVGTS